MSPNSPHRPPRPKRKLGQILAKTAPQLAHALGGPLAGAAVSTIARVVFGREAMSHAQIEAALDQASPEQWMALRRAEQEFEQAMAAHAVSFAQIAADDRDSARARHIALKDRSPAILGGLIIGGFFVVLGAMLVVGWPNGAPEAYSIMLGALATMTAAVVNYFFGSSAGSREKTRFLTVPSEFLSAGRAKVGSADQ